MMTSHASQEKFAKHCCKQADEVNACFPIDQKHATSQIITYITVYLYYCMCIYLCQPSIFREIVN